jgi:hypothetical protein
MSRVSFFQRFSQRENHATNNTLLVLRHFYQSSPHKIQRALSALVGKKVSIGLTFDQQVSGKRSVPDALVRQESLRIFFETKRGESLDFDQLARHVESIAARTPGASDDILIGLTKEPVSERDKEKFRSRAASRKVLFVAATFSQILDALRFECADFERDLLDILDDYERYLAEEGLLEEGNKWLAVFPCGISFGDNKRFNLYYEPPSRPCKRNHFIGIYTQKRVSLVGSVEAIAVCAYKHRSLRPTIEAGTFTGDHRDRLRRVIEATEYFDLKSEPHRFYLVDAFVETDFQKVSPGGLLQLRYLDLSEAVSGFNPRHNYSTAELAELVRGRTFA